MLKSLAIGLAVGFTATAALAQVPPVCRQGSPCVVDSKGEFVGVGGIGPVTHIFAGKEYLLGLDNRDLTRVALAFFYPNAGCSGAPMFVDNSTIPVAVVDLNGFVYVPQRPAPAGLKAASYSFGLTGTCNTYPTIGNTQDLTLAILVDQTYVKSLVPPFGPLEPNSPVAPVAAK